MKILIAGGAGFIGTNLIRLFLKKYPSYRIVNLDALITGNAENLAKFEKRENYHFIHGNICNEEFIEKLFKEENFEAVINLASEVTPENFIKTDVYGNYVLLEAARRHKVKRFIYVSSDEVYGETETEEGTLRPSIEEDPLRPQIPQAASKAGADVLTFSYYQAYQLPIVILRPSNLFGPYQQSEKLVALLISQTLEGKPLPIFGDGKHSRDFMHVSDFCTALDLALHKEEAVGEIFNVSGGFEHTILELTELVLTILDRPKTLIEFIEDTQAHTRRRSLDASKIREVLKWKPEVDFVKGLEETCRWYKEGIER